MEPNRRAAGSGRPLLFRAAGAVVVVAAVAFLLLDRTGPPPSVLVVTIDTLRADAAAQEMPALDGLAARGVWYAGARTPAPLTLPAHATILSGLDPADHGLRDNTAAPLPAERGFPLLAEQFRDAGYATAAFVAASVLDARFGLDAGFGEYRQPPPHGGGATAFRPLPAEEQVRRFREWLETRPGDRPFFAWVHLWEPHAPYEEWAGDERRAGTSATTDGPALLYRGEVRRADAALEALLELVDPATTLVVVASDHGESLGEHGEATHGLLCYGATMDVPLVLAGPGVPRGRVEEAPCGLADVAPTVRRLCRLPPAPGPGRDLLDLPRERVVAGESLYAHRLYGWAQQSCATDGAFSLVDGGPRLELFDLRSDPAETAPLPDPTHHPAYGPLDRALLGYRERRGREGGGDPLAGAPAYYGSLRIPVGEFLRPADNRMLRDVRDGFPAIALLDRANGATAASQRTVLQALLPDLEALEQADPANPAPSLALGRALLLGLGRPAEAARALERARERGYASPDLLFLLERAYGEAGDAEGVARIREERKNAPK